MKEVIYYEFDRVPVRISEDLVLHPCYKMKTKVLSKDVNEWIRWLLEEARNYIPDDRYKTIYIGVWNTGYGTWALR